MPSITVINRSPGTRYYLSNSFSVAEDGTNTATDLTAFLISKDSQLIYDCSNSVVSVSDGTNVYINNAATNYLQSVSTSIGAAVIGYAGSAAPSYQITVGGKTSGGLSLPARMNQFGDLATNYRNSFSNLTGNGTTTVKSGFGTLHGVMINNNSTGGVIKIYDNTAGSGTVISTIQCGSPSGGLLSASGIPASTFLGPLGLEFSTGITVVRSGSSSNDVTIIYQ